MPRSLLLDPDWDMKSHPSLDPTGENSLNQERDKNYLFKVFLNKEFLMLIEGLQIQNPLYLQQHNFVKVNS